MVQRVGIDFGTTNSLISVITRANRAKCFDDTQRPHPSVVRYEGEQVICGKRARDKLEKLGIGVLGNTVRGPKKLLGNEHINVDGRVMTPVEVIADYMKYLVAHARDNDIDQIADLTRAVVTIPVALGGRGRQALREAMLSAGVYVETFVHEPLAALYGYFKDQPDTRDVLAYYDGKMVLVFDWGGGTLDLTLCKIINGSIVQVLNRGNNLVGGDYLDDAILNHVTDEHANKFGWSAESKLPVNPGMRAKLITQCEQAKITLSTRDKTNIFLPDYFQGTDEESEIDIWLTRGNLEKICARLINQGINEIDSLLAADKADVDPQTLALCLATGGMVNMPLIKNKLTEIFGVSSLHISEKGDRIISEGAAWIAHDNLELALAKPFELVEARNSLLTVIHEGTRLPQRGESIQKLQSMYCSDPRDGKAIFTFKRPQMVQKSAAADPRTTYGSLVVEVNPDFPPLEERIQLTVTIDDNLILHTHAIAEDRREPVREEYYDLEFSLVVKKTADESIEKKNRLRLSVNKNDPKQLLVRANVTNDKERWEAVPGELLKEYNVKYVYLQKPMTKLQDEEYIRYQPCSACGAKWMKNCCSASSFNP
ncbi:Hsp70 family protein [Pseudomonas orientalis]|uniref:Hsp70 family protein n=1 Tax=Pseudomonas orientalis TaxID=76758 RepID=UPI0030DC58C6